MGITMFKSKQTRVKNPLAHTTRDWEANIRSVVVEPCDPGEDPLGYKAIYYLSFEAAGKMRKKSFEIGASFLAQRIHNLTKAGYKAPMTARAIESIEDKIGTALPMFLGGSGSHSGAYA